MEPRHSPGACHLFTWWRSHRLTNARWRTLFGISYLALGTAGVVVGVLMAVMVAIPRHGFDAPDAAYTSCFGLGLLAAGYGVRWGSAHRWPNPLAALALGASAAVALSQVISRWQQPLNGVGVSNAEMSLLFLVFVSILPKLLAGDQSKRSRQRC